MVNPIISISIVNYNSFEYLLECLESIRKYSNGLNIEVLIADNASENFDSYSIYDIFAHAVITINKKNMGFGYAHNRNFELSKGEYFFILNPDTLITAGCLDKIIDIFETYSNVAIVSPTLLLKDKTDSRTHKLLPDLKSAFFELLFIDDLVKFFRKIKPYAEEERMDFSRVECINGAAFAIRRDIYKFLNGFDEQFFLYFEETDLCKRVTDFLGMKIFIMEDFFIHHIYGQSSITTDVRQTIYYESFYKYFKKHSGGVIPCIVRGLIFFSGVVRLLSFQLKYFPLIRGWSVYKNKILTCLKLLSWVLFNKSASDRYAQDR